MRKEILILFFTLLLLGSLGIVSAKDFIQLNSYGAENICNNYTYSTCPDFCDKTCIPSFCKDGICTDDCDGPGSCFTKVVEEKTCEDYTYSNCPDSCSKRCIPSFCSDGRCTNDCDGPGSCFANNTNTTDSQDCVNKCIFKRGSINSGNLFKINNGKYEDMFSKGLHKGFENSKNKSNFDLRKYLDICIFKCDSKN